MAERGTNLGQTGRDPALRAGQSLAFLVGMGLCLVLSLSFAAGMLRCSKTGTVISAGERVNPNEAPVASLRRLPQIGAARARAIVAHRQRVGAQTGGQPAFKAADDLRQIKGIGPAIVEDVRPWLQFDDPPKDANESPTR
jgi:hypothetical protein